MAENKKSFILYCDLIHTVKHLTDEQKGKLFIHILEYVNGGNPQTDNIITKLSFEPIKQSLKRNLEKYESRAKRSRENGKLGGRPKNPEKPIRLINNLTKPKKPDSVSVSVSDSDSVSDIVSDSVSDSVILLEKETKEKTISPKTEKVFEESILKTYNSCLIFFESHLQPKSQKQKNAWLDTIEKLNRIEKVPLDKIVEVTKNARQDDFWSKNFLSLTKLRTKKDGIHYITILNEKFKGNRNITIDEILQYSAQSEIAKNFEF